MSIPVVRPRVRSIAAVTLAALALLARAPEPSAATTELFFSEYVEGSSNNKALEIYNGTGAAVNLATAGYNVQMFFNGSTSAGVTINLTGTVANGEVYVVAQASASAAILAQADQTNSSGWFNGDDAVVLRRGTTVIDVIGQVGVDPGTEWGSGLASTADNTLRRTAATCVGDTVGSDAFVPSTQWEGFAIDTFGDLGTHAASCDGTGDTAPEVTATSPVDGATGVPIGESLTVAFSEPVNVTGAWFTLACTGGTRAASVTGGPTTFTIHPTAPLTANDSCTLVVHAAGISDQDSSDPPDVMAADYSVGFTTLDVCSQPFTRVPAIQGSGSAAAITGLVTTAGIVVGDYEGASPALRGFYIQDPDGDGDPITSDGLFVFNGNANSVNLGDYVRVTGTATEFQSQTQVGASSVVACGSGSVSPTDVSLPFPSADYLERFEGMLVRLPDTLEVTEHFQLGRFGQVVMSKGRLRQPTDLFAPGPDADALRAANRLNRLIVDDATQLQNPDPIVFGRGGSPLSASNTLRGGDTATGIIGVMTYTWAGNAASGNAWRVRPEGALHGHAHFEASNLRPASAAQRSGSVRIASMNLMNLFNTFDGASSAPPYACTLGLGGAPTDCRGADDAAEFARQWPKTVAAIIGTGADIVALNEMENDGYGPDSAIQFLIDRLNDATAPGTYAFVDADAATGQTNTLGTDAIKVAMVYKRAVVLPIGQTAALNTAAFVNGGDSEPRNRPSLAQAFEQIGTGARFVVAVNHLKSKGSACDQPATDLQGECNGVRTAAAAMLADWLAHDPTGVGDPDVLIVGDLNSYSMEDPLATLDAAGYENLLRTFAGEGAYSYVFDGEWGSLDHALASESLLPQVTGAAGWYINADEPSVLDYNVNFKSPGQQSSLYAPDAFRAADHNPLVVDLAPNVDFDATAKVTGGGSIVVARPGGVAAADEGSTATFIVNATYKPGGTVPRGSLRLLLRRTGQDGTRLYEVRSTAVTGLVRSPASGRGTVLATAVVHDVTDPWAPELVLRDAVVRVTVSDAGEPGVFADTYGATIWTASGGLWSATGWNGTGAVEEHLAEGNIQVH